MLNKLSFILTATCALMMLGCAQLTPQPAPSPVRQPASLRQPCVELPGIKSGQRGAVLDWIINAQKLYAVCASRQLRATESTDAAYSTTAKP